MQILVAIGVWLVRLGPWLLSIWGVARWLVPTAVVAAGMLWSLGELGPLLAAVEASLGDLVSMMQQSAPSSPVLGQVNRIFPLNEVMAILLSYFFLLAATTTIRAIWSFVKSATK
jgi:hypothetical protein